MYNMSPVIVLSSYDDRSWAAADREPGGWDTGDIITLKQLTWFYIQFAFCLLSCLGFRLLYPKATWGRKGWFQFTTFRSHSHSGEVRAGIQCRILKQETWTTAYWLAHHGWLGLIPYITPDYQPRSGTTHSELYLSTPVTNKDNLLLINLLT